MLNRWQRTIVDLRGNVVPYAQLQIRVESTQATATIYADRAGNELIPNGIVTADANGYAFFYAEADLYRISSMQPTIDWRYVDIGSANAVRIATEALDENMVTYPTLAELEADTTRDVNSMGRVVNDGSNNGYYLWDGASWVRTSYQPMQRDEFDDLVLHVENDYLRKDIEQSAPLLRDIPQVGVVGLPYDVDQLYAQIWAARYPGFPAPSAHFEFGAGARILSPDLTFSRASSAWGWRNGVLVEYDVNEPVFEDGGLRLEPQATNLVPWSSDLREWPSNYVEVQLTADGAGSVVTALGSDYSSAGAAFDVPLGAVFTAEFYLKNLGEEKVGFRFAANGSAASNDIIATLDAYLVGQGSVDAPRVSASGQSADAQIYRVAEDFYRVTFTATALEEQDRLGVFIYPGGHGTSYSGASVGVYGVNVVSGSFPTSYIPTHGQPATRAADNSYWAGESFNRAFNPSQGAVVLDATVYMGDVGPTGYPMILALRGDGDARLNISYNKNRNFLRGQFYDGSGQTVEDLSSVDEGWRRVKLGMSWDDNSYAFYVNGEGWAGQVGELERSVLTRLNTLFIGGVSSTYHRGGPSYWHSLTMFATRPTDAQMETLTNV